MTDDIARTILRVIRVTEALSEDPDTLGERDDLYAAGLRSLAAVRLMVALEQEFDIEFPEAALHRSAFSTVEHIRDTVAPLLVERHRGHRRSG